MGLPVTVSLNDTDRNLISRLLALLERLEVNGINIQISLNGTKVDDIKK